MTWDKQKVLDLYRTMVTIRACEESFVPRILDGTIRCPVHLYSGEEAVAVGVCKALTLDDYVFGTHRSHGHFIAKGGSVRALVAEVFCREDGCSRGRGGSMHLVDVDHGMLGAAPIVAGMIPLAAGAALAAQIRRDNRVVVSFFGDGATGEGALYEAMNFASLRRLPLIFACENNLYSTHMPIQEIRVARRISELASPFGMQVYPVDGNDLKAVHEASTHAVSECRDGRGPVFMEFLTYRQRGHVGPNDNIQGTHTDIRPAAEIADWLSRDPIPRFESFVVGAGVATPAELSDVRDQVELEISDAHDYAIRSPRPDPSEMGAYVFHP